MICKIPKEFCNVRMENGECRLERTCSPIVDQCTSENCDRIENGYCKVYVNPSAKWSHGKKCPMAPIEIENKKKDSKVRVGQQKQKRIFR